jgi:hypothetical protein
MVVLVGVVTPADGPQLSTAHVFDDCAFVDVLYKLKYFCNVQIWNMKLINAQWEK